MHLQLPRGSSTLINAFSVTCSNERVLILVSRSCVAAVLKRCVALLQCDEIWRPYSTSARAAGAQKLRSSRVSLPSLSLAGPGTLSLIRVYDNCIVDDYIFVWHRKFRIFLSWHFVARRALEASGKWWWNKRMKLGTPVSHHSKILKIRLENLMLLNMTTLCHCNESKKD